MKYTVRLESGGCSVELTEVSQEQSFVDKHALDERARGLLQTLVMAYGKDELAPDRSIVVNCDCSFESGVHKRECAMRVAQAVVAGSADRI